MPATENPRVGGSIPPLATIPFAESGFADVFARVRNWRGMTTATVSLRSTIGRHLLPRVSMMKRESFSRHSLLLLAQWHCGLRPAEAGTCGAVPGA